MSNLGYLRCSLLLFKAMSALRVNLSKSVLLPIGEAPEMHHLAHFFGGGVDYLPSSYFGLPQGANFKRKVVWDPIVERFDKRLTRWKYKLLSKRGRLTLLKSTL